MDQVQLEVIDVSELCINDMVRNNSSGIEVRIYFVYGSHSIQARKGI